MTSVLLKPKISLNGRRYSLLNPLAEGAVGYVYRVKSVNVSDFNAHYAVKKMRCQSSEQVAEARKEIQLMTTLNHPNLVPILASEVTEPRHGLVEFLLLMPLYKMSLQGVIDAGGEAGGAAGWPLCPFTSGETLLRILRNVCEGLQHIHAAGFRHADVKPGNVMLTADNLAVLGDLGSACPLIQHCSSRQQALALQETMATTTTASYRSPELFDTPSECTIDGKADVWSFGCLVYATCFSRSPFETPGTGFSSLAVVNGTYHLPNTQPEWPEDYLALIRGCLQVEMASRLSLDDVQEILQRLGRPNLSRQVRVGGEKRPSGHQHYEEGALPTLPPPLSPSPTKTFRKPNQSTPTPPLPPPQPQDTADVFNFANFEDAAAVASTSTNFADFTDFGAYNKQTSPAGEAQNPGDGDDDEFGEFV